MVEFDKDTHKYTDGDRVLISVTQLLRKHGLSPEYGKVDEEILRAAAEKGTLVHNEIETYVKTGDYGFTDELSTFIEISGREKLTPLKAEEIVYNDIAAGTYDLLCKDENGDLVLIDHKTTSTLHKGSVQWQLSIYAELSGLDIKKIAVIHYPTERLIYLDKIPTDRINALFDAERNGGELPATVDNELVLKVGECETAILAIESHLKEIKEQAENYRQALLQAMLQNGVKTIDTGSLRITVKDASTRESIDTARLKKELPEVAAQYLKTATVKASLLVKVRSDNGTED